MWKKVARVLDKKHSGRIVRIILMGVVGLQLSEAIQAIVGRDSAELSAHVASIIALLAIAQISVLSERIKAQSEISKRQGTLILNLMGLDSDENGHVHRISDQKEHERRQKIEPDHDDSSCVCCCVTCSVISPLRSS